MNQQYYDRFTDFAKKVQEPIQAITELNVKTLQGLHYLKPEELTRIKPDELIEKQVHLAVENGHIALDYMQKSFKIVEKVMLDLVKDTKKTVEGKK